MDDPVFLTFAAMLVALAIAVVGWLIDADDP